MEEINTIGKCYECGKAFSSEDMEYTKLRGNLLCIPCYQYLTEYVEESIGLEE